MSDKPEWGTYVITLLGISFQVNVFYNFLLQEFTERPEWFIIFSTGHLLMKLFLQGADILVSSLLPDLIGCRGPPSLFLFCPVLDSYNIMM